MGNGVHTLSMHIEEVGPQLEGEHMQHDEGVVKGVTAALPAPWHVPVAHAVPSAMLYVQPLTLFRGSHTPQPSALESPATRRMFEIQQVVTSPGPEQDVAVTRSRAAARRSVQRSDDIFFTHVCDRDDCATAERVHE